MLEFHFATMRGGKSTALLQRRHDLLAIGKAVAVLTSSLDVRHGIGKVSSRMGPQCDARLFTRVTSFEREDFDDFDEVLIDEAQFLTGEQVRQIHRNLSGRGGLHVVCYGLRTDFQGNLFEGAAALLGLADELTKISTRCRCGAWATMNLRVDEQGAPVRTGAVLEIGGDTRYRPVCASCFY